jgi:hypothetical protein
LLKTQQWRFYAYKAIFIMVSSAHQIISARRDVFKAFYDSRASVGAFLPRGYLGSFKTALFRYNPGILMESQLNAINRNRLQQIATDHNKLTEGLLGLR